jgi:hypothetical protein
MSISSPVDFIGVPPRSWSAHQLHHTDASHLYVTSTWGLSLSFLLVAWGLSMALYGDFYMALDTKAIRRRLLPTDNSEQTRMAQYGR